MARTFGVGDEIEAYFAVSGLYLSILHILQTGSLTVIFVPKYHRLKEICGRASSYELITVVMNWLLLAAIFLVGLGIIFRSSLIDLRVPGFNEAKQLVCENFLIWVLPLVILDTCSAFIRCIINAEKIYGKPELVVSFSLFGQFVVAWSFSPTFGVQALIGGLYVSSIIRILGFGAIVSKQNYTYQLVFRSNYFEFRDIYSNLRLTTLYTLATQSFLFAFDAALSNLQSGKFAIFHYYKKLFTLTQGMLMKPINIIFFNQFSNDFSNGKNTRKLKEDSLDLSLFFFSIVAVFGVIFLTDFLSIAFRDSNLKPKDISTLSYLFKISSFILLINVYQQFLFKIVMVTGVVSKLYTMMSISQIITALFTLFFTPSISLLIAVGIMFFNGTVLLSCGIWLTLKDSREEFCFFKMFDLIRYTILGLGTCTVGLYICRETKNYFENDTLVFVLNLIMVGLLLALWGNILKIKEFALVSSKIRLGLSKCFWCREP
ncbi:hypothetical protein N9200_00655 [Akkermansiaceae bacterium]|nr:hypothetical protein [Akkermansiaceae bacterium]